MQSGLGVSTVSLVVLSTEQLCSLLKRKETRLLLSNNVQRLGKRHGKACEVESDQEVLLDLTVGTVTSCVSSEDQVETETEKYETIKTKSVKKRMTAQNTGIYNLDNNKNLD